MTNKTIIHTPMGSFETQAALIKLLRPWLYKRPVGEFILDKDICELLTFLFNSRSEKTASIKSRSIVGWRTLGNEGFTTCFGAYLDDGSSINMSYLKTIRMLFQRARGNA